MNPVLPLEHFVPDSEARSWSDGRVYVYGSYDISGNASYCSREYRVFSSEDLEQWQDHGVAFTTDPGISKLTNAPAADELWREQTLFAPDCVYHRGRYYLFFCTSTKGEGVAVSDGPSRPFLDPTPVRGAHGDAIDPAAFVDDDGAVYLFWGQFDARGAKLRDDCVGIDESTLVASLINERDHGFHEGSSLRKRNGVYYLVYADISRGRPTCLGYATADSPLGPYEKRGIIIDNTGCDPETWNNHGSIERVGNRWYVFYHRSSQGTRFNRRLCIEPIVFESDGSIPEVEMTSGGVSGPLDPFQPMPAYRACVVSGGAYLAPADTKIGGEVLTNITDSSGACFRYVDFDRAAGEGRGAPTQITVQAAGKTYGGAVEVRLDEPDGELIGICNVEPTGDWREMGSFHAPLKPPTGVRAVWLVFRGSFGRLFDLRSFFFSR